MASGSMLDVLSLPLTKSPSYISKVIPMNLSFTPKYIFAVIFRTEVVTSSADTRTGASVQYYIVSNINFYKDKTIARYTSTSGYYLTFNIQNVSASSFTLTISFDSGSYYSINTHEGSSYWYAFG